MPATKERTCQDCGKKFKAIEIIDKTVSPIGGFGTNAPLQSNLEYVFPGAKKSRWTGLMPVAGKIHACMCIGCGRIEFFGRPPEG